MLLRQRQLKKSIEGGEYALEMARGRLTFAQDALKEAEGAIAGIAEGLARDRRNLGVLRIHSQRKHESGIRG